MADDRFDRNRVRKFTCKDCGHSWPYDEADKRRDPRTSKNFFRIICGSCYAKALRRIARRAVA